jgi:hypothetical protein
MLANKIERRYTIRHLRPGNLSELRRELAVQLGALKANPKAQTKATQFGDVAPVETRLQQVKP